MCYDAWFGFLQNPHGHGVAKDTSDDVLLETCLLPNFIKRHATTGGNHVRNIIAGNCIDAHQVRDLEKSIISGFNLGVISAVGRNTYRSELVQKYERMQEQLVEFGRSIEYSIPQLGYIGGIYSGKVLVERRAGQSLGG